MKLFLMFIALSTNLHSATISKDKLIEFADKYSYRDNRKTLQKDNMYSASKDCCGEKPWTVIQGYNNKSEYKQVALICDQCETLVQTPEQKELCISTFNNLYNLLGGNHPIDIKEAIDKKTTLLNSDKSKFKIKISGGSLKCDTKSGTRLRIDFFSK